MPDWKLLLKAIGFTVVVAALAAIGAALLTVVLMTVAYLLINWPWLWLVVAFGLMVKAAYDTLKDFRDFDK